MQYSLEHVMRFNSKVKMELYHQGSGLSKVSEMQMKLIRIELDKKHQGNPNYRDGQYYPPKEEW